MASAPTAAGSRGTGSHTIGFDGSSHSSAVTYFCTRSAALSNATPSIQLKELLARDAIPVVADILARTAESSGRAAESIVAGGEPISARPLDLSAANDLLSTVVKRNLELAAEDDPLRRAIVAVT